MFKALERNNNELSPSTAEVEDQGRDQLSRKAKASYLRGNL